MFANANKFVKSSRLKSNEISTLFFSFFFFLYVKLLSGLANQQFCCKRDVMCAVIIVSTDNTLNYLLVTNLQIVKEDLINVKHNFDRLISSLLSDKLMDDVLQFPYTMVSNNIYYNLELHDTLKFRSILLLLLSRTHQGAFTSDLKTLDGVVYFYS